METFFEREVSSQEASRLAGVLRLDTFTYTTRNKDLYRYMVDKLGHTINLVTSTVAMLENCYTIECKVYGRMKYADVEHMVASFERGYFSKAKE